MFSHNLQGLTISANSQIVESVILLGFTRDLNVDKLKWMTWYRIYSTNQILPAPQTKLEQFIFYAKMKNEVKSYIIKYLSPGTEYMHEYGVGNFGH